MTADSGIRAAEERAIRARLQEVARPDSRFQFDLDCFIPDFPGSADAARRVRNHPAYSGSQLVFATPDNALLPMREMLLADGKMLIIPSYGLSQGFLLMDPKTIPADACRYAAWLDGVQHFGTTITLAEMARLPLIDFCVVGAAAVASNGTRFGMGYHYFDVEWALLTGAGLTDPDAPVIVPVHDCQLSDADVPPSRAHVGATMIVTPSGEVAAPALLAPRPSTLDAVIIPPELSDVEVVREYRAIVGQA